MLTSLACYKVVELAQRAQPQSGHQNRNLWYRTHPLLGAHAYVSTGRKWVLNTE